MKQKELLSILSKKHKGQLIRIKYRTCPKLTASAEKMGFSVIKIAETTVRWGVNYGHIASVIAKKAKETSGTSVYKPWWHWSVPNVIQQHNTKGTEYLAVYTIPKNSNPKVRYIVSYNGTEEEVSRQDLQNRNLLPNSYWNKTEDPIMLSINIENILSIK